MAWAFSGSQKQFTGAATSIAGALGFTPAAGSTLVVTTAGRLSAASAMSGCGATWTVTATANASAVHCNVWIGANCDGVNSTLTDTWPDAANHAIEVAGFTGGATSPADLNGTATGSSTTPATGSLTPSINDALVIAFTGVDKLTGQSITDPPSGGFTALSQVVSGGQVTATAYKILSGAGTAQSASWTISPSTDWGTIILSLKPAAAGAHALAGTIAAVSNLPAATLTTSPAIVRAVPLLRVDWWNLGRFTDPLDTVHPLDHPGLTFTRGRSGDFTTDMAGQMSFALDNSDNAYSLDRNWLDNPSFEVDTSGWSTAASAFTAAATSITQVADVATGTGTKAGEVVATATLNSGTSYPIPYRFRRQVSHTITVWIKSMSGSVNVQGGIGSSGTPADVVTTASGITAGWLAYTVAWMPSADRTDAVLFLRTTTAAAATFRVDAISVTPNASAYQSAVLATAPVGYWRLDEASGTVAADASGGGYLGAYVGAPTLGAAGLLTGDGDTAVALNGTTQYVTVPHAAALNTANWSVAVIAKVTGGAGTNRAIVSNRYINGAVLQGWIIYANSADLWSLNTLATGAFLALDGPAVTLNAITQIVATFDGTTARLYINGSLVAAAARSVDINTTAPFQIGAGQNEAPANFYTPGTIDEPAIWNRALSAAEVATLYTAVTPGVAVPYIEAPTRGQLVPGRPVHLQSAYSGTNYPRFFGRIERITPNPIERTVTITVQDEIRKMQETEIIVAANPYVQRTAREMRIEALSDFERGTVNLCDNGLAATNLNGWTTEAGTATRITTDNAPGLGSTCVNFVGNSLYGRLHFPIRYAPAFFSVETYRMSFWAKLVSGPPAWTFGPWNASAFLATHVVALATTWTRYSWTIALPGTYTGVSPLEWVAEARAAGTIRVAGLMVTRGYADPVYAATDVTAGRMPSWCGNGSFDAGSTAGWVDPQPNLIGANPSFETNTAGWSAAGDAFTSAPTTFSQVAGDAAYGSAHAEVTVPAVNGSGVFYAISGTFKLGLVYPWMISVKNAAAGPNNVAAGIGSQGTPADVIVSGGTVTNAGYTVFSGTWTPTADRADAHFFVRSTAAAWTMKIDGAAVFGPRPLAQLGNVDPTYSDTGPGGGGAPLSSPNLIGNPGFEDGTATGWAVTADAFHAAGTSIVADLTFPLVGAYAAKIIAPTGGGAHYPITGTFTAGAVYTAIVHAIVAGGAGSMAITLGSQGTPADAVTSAALATSATYATATVTWTPTANRTDAHLAVVLLDGTTTYIDVVSVVSIVLTTSATARWGSRSLSLTTPATAGAGQLYDFAYFGVYFRSGQPFTAQVWLRPSSSMPYKVGIGANSGTGPWDEAFVTGTAAANVWTQVTVTWTPTADRSAGTAWQTALYIYQTDATARTILIDGVRVTPGSTADAFEQSYWNIPAAAEQDLMQISTQLTGKLAAALKQLNDLVLSRHWISASLTTPFWTYNLQDRVTYAAATSAETYTDGLTTQMQALEAPELDRQTIVNAVPVSTSFGTEYYSDATSIIEYGYRPANAISAVGFFATAAIGATVAAAYLSRYSQPIRRPRIIVENRWPSQLQRDVNDMVILTVAGWQIVGLAANIATLTTVMDQAGRHEKTTYVLEETPNAV